MGVRESLQKLIDRKTAEIERMEGELRDARVYLQALQDSFRLVPKESTADAAPRELRAGTALARVRTFLKESGQPQHISAILNFLGKPQDTASRVSLAGSLGGYARDGKIFTRPAPNTFGLIEFGDGSPELESLRALPEDFGKA
jgi:hypothetical protein